MCVRHAQPHQLFGSAQLKEAHVLNEYMGIDRDGGPGDVIIHFHVRFQGVGFPPTTALVRPSILSPER